MIKDPPTGGMPVALAGGECAAPRASGAWPQTKSPGSSAGWGGEIFPKKYLQKKTRFRCAGCKEKKETVLPVLGGWAPPGGGYGYPVQPQGGGPTEVKYFREIFEKKLANSSRGKKRKEKPGLGCWGGSGQAFRGGPGYLAQPGGRAY